jgi:hypothetical protein
MANAMPPNKGIWSREEHERYLEAIHPFLSWDHVARFVGTRSPVQCRSHDQKIKKKLRNANQRGRARPPRVEHRLPLPAVPGEYEEWHDDIGCVRYQGADHRDGGFLVCFIESTKAFQSTVTTEHLKVVSPLPPANLPISPFSVDDALNASAWPAGPPDLGGDAVHPHSPFDFGDTFLDLDELLGDDDMDLDPPIA